MRLFSRLVLFAALCAVPLLVPKADAAEKYLGTLFVTDAGAVHNYFPTDGGAFGIPGQTLLTVQPDVAAYVCVNEFGTTPAIPICTAARGVRVEANVGFPTSCPNSRQILMADGGYVNGCVVGVRPVTGTTVTAPVWSRQADGARPEF